MFELQPISAEVKIEGFHTIYYFEFGKNFTHTPEKHDFWEMVYVDSGRIVAITDGIGYRLHQGQALFHQPGEIHAHCSDNEVSNNMFIISFSADIKNADFFKKKIFTLDKTQQTLLSLFLEEAKKALGAIPHTYENKENLDFSNAPYGSTQLLGCYLTELIIKLIRGDSSLSKKITLDVRSREIAKNSVAEMIIEYLKENVYSSLSLNDVCSHFLIGKSQLSIIFNSYTGKSPMDYYNTLKIHEAKKLLRESSLSVNEISDKLGYSSIHNFSRAFKKAVSVSPLTYKKSIR